MLNSPLVGPPFVCFTRCLTGKRSFLLTASSLRPLTGVIALSRVDQHARHERQLVRGMMCRDAWQICHEIQLEYVFGTGNDVHLSGSREPFDVVRLAS